MNHASDRLIAGYAAGAELPGDQMWALEAHLETCAFCRARLAEAAPTESLVESVWDGLDLTPVPRRRRRPVRLVNWVTPAMVPWLAMIGFVIVAAFALGELWQDVSALQLFAPVLPVLGVAASWARGLDPAYEVVAATPRSGLYLVLRRTLVVLAIVLPLLFVTGWASVGIWLLPSLAFTTGTLALGGLIGVTRAAYALVAVWGAVFFLPTLAKQEQTFALHPGAIPVWGGVFALTVVVVALRRNAFTRLDAHN